MKVNQFRSVEGKGDCLAEGGGHIVVHGFLTKLWDFYYRSFLTLPYHINNRITLHKTLRTEPHLNVLALPLFFLVHSWCQVSLLYFYIASTIQRHNFTWPCRFVGKYSGKWIVSRETDTSSSQTLMSSIFVNVANIRPAERPEQNPNATLCHRTEQNNSNVALECSGWFLWTFATAKLTQ